MMAYRFLLFVGHFIHDGAFASVQKDDQTGFYVPEATRPLDEADMLASAIDVCGGDSSRVLNWDVKIESSRITFCELRDRKALDWVWTLIREQNVDVVDGTMRVLPASEVDAMAGRD